MTEQKQITSDEQRNGFVAAGYGLVHASAEEEIWSDGETGVKLSPDLADVEFFSELEGEPVPINKALQVASILGQAPPGYVLVSEEEANQTASLLRMLIQENGTLPPFTDKAVAALWHLEEAFTALSPKKEAKE